MKLYQSFGTSRTILTPKLRYIWTHFTSEEYPPTVSSYIRYFAASSAGIRYQIVQSFTSLKRSGQCTQYHVEEFEYILQGLLRHTHALTNEIYDAYVLSRKDKLRLHRMMHANELLWQEFELLLREMSFLSHKN